MTTEALGLFHFTAPAILPLAGLVLTTALGLFVWSRNWRSPLHRCFAAINLAAALWNLDVFLLFTLTDGAVAGALDRLFQIPIVTLPFLGLLFIFLLLRRSLRHPLLLAFGIWTGVLLGLCTTPFFIEGWRSHWFGFYGIAGPFYALFVAAHFFYLAASSWLLWRETTRDGPEFRRREFTLLLTANLTLGAISIDNFAPLYGAERLPLGNLAAVAYFIIMAVTIVRFRFLDIRMVRYGTVYTALTALLSLAYISVVLGVQGWFQGEIASGSLAAPMIAALVAAAAAGPVKGALQRRIDRRFSRSRARLRTALTTFAAEAGRAVSEEALWSLAWERGWSLLSPRSGGIVVRHPDGGLLPAGVPPAPAWAERLLPESGSDLRWCTPPPGSGAGPGEDDFLLVPVRCGGELFGTACLGPHEGGEEYGDEDEAFAVGIASQCALAVERLRMREKVKREERLAAFGRSAAAVSHELRRPLGVIRGAVRLLRSPELRDGGRELLRLIGEEVDRTDEFVGEFLSACREPRPVLVPLGLHQALRVFARRWPPQEFSRLRLTLKVPEEEVVVRADPFQLERVFENIVRNAAELLPRVGEVQVATERIDAHTVAISFRDDGPGIDRRLQGRLFEPFVTAKRGSTGLGLSIVRGIVAAHGGRVSGGDAPGGGALFTVFLPLPSESHPDVGETGAA